MTMTTGKLQLFKMLHQDLRQCKAFSFITLLFCCLTIIEGYISVKYSEVDKFGSSCPVLDSCEYRKSMNNTAMEGNGFNCACDYLCSEYGDCCIDARIYHSRGNIDSMKCFEVGQLGGIYMKDSCSPEYKDSDEVRNLCHKTKLGDQADPLASLPVTDTLTGITYKNYYCSMCNKKSDSMVMWIPKLECPLLSLFYSSKNITDDYIHQSLTTDGKNWGLYLHGEDEPSFFHDCEISTVLPKQLEHKVRFCTPNLVSDCPLSWGNKDIREMCKLYTGARFIQGDDFGYKNIHCAHCNGENVTQLSCQPTKPDIFDIFRFTGTHSFALLLDINEANGNQVGKIKMCKTGDVYDPFFKKCRSLSCLSGFVRRGKRCFPRHRKFMWKAMKKVYVNSNQPSSLTYNVASTSAKPLEKNQPTTILPLKPISSTSIEPFEISMNITTHIYKLSTAPSLSSEAVTNSTTSNLIESRDPTEMNRNDLNTNHELSTTSLLTSEGISPQAPDFLTTFMSYLLNTTISDTCKKLLFSKFLLSELISW